MLDMRRLDAYVIWCKNTMGEVGWHLHFPDYVNSKIEIANDFYTKIGWHLHFPDKTDSEFKITNDFYMEIDNNSDATAFKLKFGL